MIYRVTEELKETHLLPLDESKTYTLLEFKDVLITKRQDCLQMLKKLSQYRTVLLNVVLQCFSIIIIHNIFTK